MIEIFAKNYLTTKNRKLFSQKVSSDVWQGPKYPSEQVISCSGDLIHVDHDADHDLDSVGVFG